ncbi:MAG: hypothetical protein LBI30_02725 [Holosporales bacterium]|jgi:phosphohistidine swiveling domain-containing protein|nr:hypothetical protein [Holosporales bacterium]
MKISYSFGIIELLHVGHITALESAKSSSDLHIFGLVGDESVIKWKGGVISSFEERKRVLSRLSLIDLILPQNTFDPSCNLRKIHDLYPEAAITLYKEANWGIFPNEALMRDVNAKLEIVEHSDNFSPDHIIENMARLSEPRYKFENIISTKANTLLSLKPKIKKSKIEDALVITVADFLYRKGEILKSIQGKFKGCKIVVRSSSSYEDNFEKSVAGFFESKLGVDSKNENKISEAVNTVINSYRKVESLDLEHEQILIQSKTEDIASAGVVFTRDVKRNRPYYFINYDDDGLSHSVTSGRGGEGSIYIVRDIEISNPKWHGLLEAVREIEGTLENVILDIEFAIKRDASIIIFQARPLALAYKSRSLTNDIRVLELLNEEQRKYENNLDAFYKKQMLLSDMAFWNPAEIIGDNPKPLDFSLYREIITSSPWNAGLVPLGYKKVPYDLMYKIGNKPYISVDYSFRSLIPNDLSDDITAKLVNFYREKLKANPRSHDKIEFEIVFSCFDFETEEKLEELEGILSKGEVLALKRSLWEMTRRAVGNFFAILSEDKIAIKALEQTREEIASKYTVFGWKKALSCFSELLSLLKIHGTPQFSRQARYAFIAKSFCRSLVSQKYCPSEKIDNFMLSVKTVATELSENMDAFFSDKITLDDFNKKYGHLRSGTYDITTLPYSKMDFRTSSFRKTKRANKKPMPFDINFIGKALNKINFDETPEKFISFLKTAFEQREFFKFEFTKSLSLAIEILASVGDRFGFSREELSFLTVEDVLSSQNYHTEEDLKDFWSSVIEGRKKAFENNSWLILPDVILNSDDLFFVEWKKMRPNFVTEKSVRGEVVILEDTDQITDKIVLLEKADPGFDWVFSKNIKALITKYGGAASHMAIRCGEFGLPAAIGCGEKIYNETLGMKRIELDCKKGVIKEII